MVSTSKIKLWLYQLEAIFHLSLLWFLFLIVRVPAESPWPEIVHMPYNANVYINCTLERQSTPFWEISLADFTLDLRFSDEANQRQTLKDRGVYNLPLIPGMPPILRLLVNKTEVNNNTVIKCSDFSNDDRQTTLYLYGTYYNYCKIQCVLIL